jgi:hypothetical protein
MQRPAKCQTARIMFEITLGTCEIASASLTWWTPPKLCPKAPSVMKKPTNKNRVEKSLFFMFLLLIINLCQAVSGCGPLLFEKTV